MGYARIKHNFNLNEVFITHWEVPPTLIQTIDLFYTSQNISHVVTQIPNWNFGEKMKYSFNYYLYNHFPEASEENCFLETSDFIEFNYTHIKDIDVIIQVAAGRNTSRIIQPCQIRGLALKNPAKKFILVGWRDYNLYSDLGKNVINKIHLTTMNEFVNLLCSCNSFIGPTGFGTIIAALSQKEVFFTHNLDSRYINSAWNTTEITALTEVNFG